MNACWRKILGLTDRQMDWMEQLSSKITNDHQSLLPKCVSFLLGDFSIESCNGLVSILITIGFNVPDDEL